MKVSWVVSWVTAARCGLAVAAATLVIFVPAGRTVAETSDGDSPIEEILVVGARLPRPVQDVLGTVDVVSRDAILNAIAVDSAGAVRYLTGVSVAQADNRFGATEFTIRGLSGNRVTTLIDGIPIADQFDIGAFSNAGQDFLVPDAVSRIEILRGPASTLFGSDALGGVVAIMTRDPEEYLRGQGPRLHGSTAWSGADQSRMVSASLAAGSGSVAGVLHGSIREADEADAGATSREDPLDRRRVAAQAKLSWSLANGNTLRLNGQLFDETVDVDARAVLGYGRQASTTSLRGEDARRREALGLEYEFGGSGTWADAGRVTLFSQRTRVDQDTYERRDLARPPVELQRGFEYAFDDSGLLVDFDKSLASGSIEQRLAWGASLRRTDVDERRDGVLTNLVTGTTTNVLLGEVMPVRDFPDSRIDEVAAYVHDEIRIGRLLLIPGVRIESHRLDAREDALYRKTNPGIAAVDLDETAIAPKLGAQWRAGAATTVFAQYARGYRAPPFEDVNIGLYYPLFNVRAIANPDLRSETSDGIELGLRHDTGRLSFDIALFGADYDDFIESKVNLGIEPETGTLLFQSRNVAEARIYGIDLRAEMPVSDTLDLSASGNWTRGEDRDTGEPLSTIDPPSLVTQLNWRPLPRWSGTLAVTAAAAQHEVDDSTIEPFQPDAYVVFDLLARYQPRNNLRLQFGIFNVSNQTYWRWASVRGRPEGDPLIDLLSAPGRHGAVSMHVDF